MSLIANLVQIGLVYKPVNMSQIDKLVPISQNVDMF